MVLSILLLGLLPAIDTWSSSWGRSNVPLEWYRDIRKFSARSELKQEDNGSFYMKPIEAADNTLVQGLKKTVKKDGTPSYAYRTHQCHICSRSVTGFDRQDSNMLVTCPKESRRIPFFTKVHRKHIMNFSPR
jgi:hypothetical protein